MLLAIALATQGVAGNIAGNMGNRWRHRWRLLESILDTGEGRHKYVRRITLLRTIQRHCARPCRPVRRHARRVYKNRNYGTDIYGIMGTDSTYSNTPSQTLGLVARRRGQVVCNCRSAVSGREAW